MDFDTLQKQIQRWTNSVPLIILGSGASVPFNIPSMFALGEHLKNSISFTAKEDQAQFDLFKDHFDKTGDLESTLLEINLRESVLHEIICKTWELINEKDLLVYEQIIQKSIEFPLSDLVRYLINTTRKKVSIVTTNYDRLAEYAASLANAFICSGFIHNHRGCFSKDIHKNDLSKMIGCSGSVNIWKVHGSLDWFRFSDENDYYLPLRQTVPDNHIPSIVTPGLSKYFQTQLEPYRTIFTEADSEVEKATSYLCIGYGFNDLHVQPKLIAQIKNEKPIIVITKELTSKTKEEIIGNNCKQYILIEQANSNDTRVYSSFFTGEEIIPNENFWMLQEYLKLIK